MCDDCSMPRMSRRNLILGGMVLASAAMLPRYACARTPQNAISPDEALHRLMEGNARYAANAPAQRDFSARREMLAQSQHPVAAILSCADSRIAPELAFDQGPGDLFVIRVAGNFVNEDGLASIEYAVKYLNTPLIMVLGHSSCGAVGAAIKVAREGITLPGHLQGMMRDIGPAVEAVKASGQDDILPAAIVENVRRNVRRLEMAEPILASLVGDRKIKVVGAHYELTNGQITLV